MKHSKHHNQVRIIGGTHRGRKLVVVDAEGLRPTADSVRERLFNWLGQDLSGKTVLDLFSGSGALGFEAASRQAADVVLVEQNRIVARQLQCQAAALALPTVTVHCAEALAFLQQHAGRFDVVLLDPPFAWQQWPLMLSRLPVHLNADAWVYAEAGRLPEWPASWQVWRQGKAGASHFVLLRHNTDGN